MKKTIYEGGFSMNTITRQTACGAIRGRALENQEQYLGIRYATAERFAYAEEVTGWQGEYDATDFGDACIQKRVWYEHLEIPQRAFYHKEFREGITFRHSEDCLNLNIYTPKKEGVFPVLVFIHGGGFDSGCNYDTAIDGSAYAEKDIVFVSINYRVGVFGYLTHEEVKKTYGREGNFGLDDQLIALRWIKRNIADYRGDADNITVMGQSAGAISIQYLCLSEKCRGLFAHAVMISGGGMFPKFALPRPAEDTREYWLDLMKTAGCKSFEEFQAADAKAVFTAWEDVKARRKDNQFCTMPVVDGDLIAAPIDTIIGHPLPIDYMMGYTNNDMYAPVMAHINHKFARDNGAYLYYFDIDAPGSDRNAAFHSADLRYIFGTLGKSHRPYNANDQKISEMMMGYIIQFAKTGDPNGGSRPVWEKAGRKALHIVNDPAGVKMGRPNWLKLAKNMLTIGDPKI